jgi:hypothetical protein
VEPIESYADQLIREMNARTDSVKRINDSILNEREKHPWRIETYNDEFGDPTKEKFAYTSSTGTFSNSATTDAHLFVSIMIDKEAAGIMLYEYDANRSPVSFIGSDGSINMKNEAGQKIVITNCLFKWNQQGGVKLTNAINSNFSRFKKFILQSTGKIKVVMYDKYSSEYNFTINANGFSEILSQL